MRTFKCGATQRGHVDQERSHVAYDNHDASRMDITGRCLAMRVGKLSRSYHPWVFILVLGHQVQGDVGGGQWHKGMGGGGGGSGTRGRGSGQWYKGMGGGQLRHAAIRSGCNVRIRLQPCLPDEDESIHCAGGAGASEGSIGTSLTCQNDTSLTLRRRANATSPLPPRAPHLIPWVAAPPNVHSFGLCFHWTMRRRHRAVLEGAGGAPISRLHYTQ